MRCNLTINLSKGEVQPEAGESATCVCIKSKDAGKKVHHSTLKAALSGESHNLAITMDKSHGSLASHLVVTK